MRQRQLDVTLPLVAQRRRYQVDVAHDPKAARYVRISGNQHKADSWLFLARQSLGVRLGDQADVQLEVRSQGRFAFYAPVLIEHVSFEHTGAAVCTSLAANVSSNLVFVQVTQIPHCWRILG